MKHNLKNLNSLRRKKRIRAKLSGTALRPRVSVFKSNQNIFVQLIDDDGGKTIFSNKVASTKKGKAKGTKTEKAFAIGEMLAKQAKDADIKEAIFDKSSFKYHGRVKAVAEGLRSGGIKI